MGFGLTPVAPKKFEGRAVWIDVNEKEVRNGMPEESKAIYQLMGGDEPYYMSPMSYNITQWDKLRSLLAFWQVPVSLPFSNDGEVVQEKDCMIIAKALHDHPLWWIYVWGVDTSSLPEDCDGAAACCSYCKKTNVPLSRCSACRGPQRYCSRSCKTYYHLSSLLMLPLTVVFQYVIDVFYSQYY